MMGARGKIDVLIPRGGRELIQRVVTTAKVPVIETGEGNVHIYLDESADAKMAVPILLNAKIQRPSVCNTVETLLINAKSQAAGQVLAALAKSGCAPARRRTRRGTGGGHPDDPGRRRGLGHRIHGPGPGRRRRRRPRWCH